METKEIIDTLRICADGDIICPACPRYERSMNYGSAYCFYELMLEAADTIESQQNRIAELEAALQEQEERRWIPASEPPKESEHVLVCTKHRKPFKARYYPDRKRWDVSGSVVITHWMPLPEPPKGD